MNLFWGVDRKLEIADLLLSLCRCKSTAFCLDHTEFYVEKIGSAPIIL